MGAEWAGSVQVFGGNTGQDTCGVGADRVLGKAGMFQAGLVTGGAPPKDGPVIQSMWGL